MNTFRFVGFALFFILSCLAACSDDNSSIGIIPNPEETESEIIIDSNILTNGLSFSSDGGTQSISFTTNVNWTLNIAPTISGTTWCTATTISGTKGNVNLKLTVIENTSYENRSVSVTIKSGTASKTFIVSQKGIDALLVTTDKYELGQEGGIIEIEVKANIDYKMEISDQAKSWIKESSSRTHLETYKHTLIVAANEEVDKRQGEIYFKSENKQETVKIYQTGNEIILLSQNEYNVSYMGDTISVDIKSNIEFGIQMPNINWIIDETSTRGLNSHTLKFIVYPNDTYDMRSTEIIIYDKNSSLQEKFSIIQEALNDNGSLFIANWKEDNPTIYASGGETILSITSSTTWSATVLNAELNTWVNLEDFNRNQEKGSLHITTSANNMSTDRIAYICVKNKKDVRLIKIHQRQNIITRIPFEERNIHNSLTMEYDAMNFTKVISVLPVPQSNMYQDVIGCTSNDGTLKIAGDGINKYITRIILPGQFPSSGKSLLYEDFKIKNYRIYTNFDAITTQIAIDEDTDTFFKYTNENGDIIIPAHYKIQEIADLLWEKSSHNNLLYAYECYEYVATHMKYLNPNSGLHPLDKILLDGGGDCGNQVSVFVSLLRNKKIPARHVVMIRTDETYHVRSEFFLAGYGWIPVDVNAKNMNQNGDYFGKIDSDEIVVSNDVNIDIELEEGEHYISPLLQTYLVWYWWTSPTSIKFNHVVKEIK